MIDPNEAPAGFVAEPFLDCAFCAFGNTSAEEMLNCFNHPCMAFERKDRTEVQFRKIEKRKGGK